MARAEWRVIRKNTYLLESFVEFIQNINQKLLSILLGLLDKSGVSLTNDQSKYLWGHTFKVSKPHVVHQIGKGCCNLSSLPETRLKEQWGYFKQQPQFPVQRELAMEIFWETLFCVLSPDEVGRHL